MKTHWDYSNLATSYLDRPSYSAKAIKFLIKTCDLKTGDLCCDVGAGVGHLTIELAKYNLKIVAIEPNNNMRNLGIIKTKKIDNITWSEGIAEDTKQLHSKYSLVSFGSSFNVCNRELALIEVARILKKSGWFCCLWNHRKLDDPLQKQIEEIIQFHLPNYTYGRRREDQTKIINKSKKFNNIIKYESNFIHSLEKKKIINAWRSHATLQRQAKNKFNKIISEIEKIINSSNFNLIKVPYSTVMWIAQLR